MHEIRGLKDKVMEITVDNDTVKVKPLVEDIEMFVTLNKGIQSKADVEVLTSVMANLIKRANSDLDIEDIRTFVGLHFVSLLNELLIIYGLTTREAIKRASDEALKKNLNPKET